MKDIKKFTSIMYFLAGVLFFIAGLLGKNYVFIPIGCCFVVLGVVYINKKNDNDKKDK